MSVLELIEAREITYAAQSDIRKLIADNREFHKLYPKWNGDPLITATVERLKITQDALTNLIKAKFK